MEKGKYKIVVSEPWDYENKNGENAIEGQIIDVISKYVVAFQSDEKLVFGEHIGNILILQSRYKDSILDLENRYIGTVGGGLYLLNDYKRESVSFLEKNSVYVLIGSLQKI